MAETVESHANREANRGSSSQGCRKPGVWAPWPGATITSTPPTLPCRRGGTRLRLARKRAAILCRNPTKQDSAGRVLAAARLPAQHQRDLEGEGVAGIGGREAGELGGLAQAVAHRVGVHEQRASRRLDRG